MITEAEMEGESFNDRSSEKLKKKHRNEGVQFDFDRVLPAFPLAGIPTTRVRETRDFSWYFAYLNEFYILLDLVNLTLSPIFAAYSTKVEWATGVQKLFAPSWVLMFAEDPSAVARIFAIQELEARTSCENGGSGTGPPIVSTVATSLFTQGPLSWATLDQMTSRLPDNTWTSQGSGYVSTKIKIAPSAATVHEGLSTVEFGSTGSLAGFAPISIAFNETDFLQSSSYASSHVLVQSGFSCYPLAGEFSLDPWAATYNATVTFCIASLITADIAGVSGYPAGTVVMTSYDVTVGANSGIVGFPLAGAALSKKVASQWSWSSDFTQVIGIVILGTSVGTQPVAYSLKMQFPAMTFAYVSSVRAGLSNLSADFSLVVTGRSCPASATGATLSYPQPVGNSDPRILVEFIGQ